MKRMSISQKRSVTVTIPILAVVFLASVVALAGDAGFQKPDTPKVLPKKMESGDVKLFDGSAPLQKFVGGPPALTIKKPFESQPINVNDDWLHIVVEVNPGFEVDTYLLEMERLEEVSGERVKSTGKTHMWQTTGSILNPSLLPFPILIKTSALTEGKLGSYRVRVRGNKGGYKGGYTQWRHFQVLDKGKVVASESLLRSSEKKTGGFVPKSDEKTMQTKQGESSLGPEGLEAKKVQGESSLGPEGLEAKTRVATIQTPKPNIVVDNVHFIPPPKSGQKTQIYVYFKNTGPGKSSKGTEFTVKCKSAPKCFLADKKVAFNKDIPPGGKYVWIFETETLRAGFYKMEVITTSNSIKNVNKRLIELNVPGLVMKKPDPVNLKDKSKKKAAVENVQPVPADPGTRKDLKKTPSRTLEY